MNREYWSVINNTILSINSIKLYENLFNYSVIVITDFLLNVIYIYQINNNMNLIPVKIGDNLSNNFGNNAILLSSINKSIAVAKYEEHAQACLNNFVSVCAPMRKENGEIIGYCAIFIKGGYFENSMVSLVELLSKLIYEKLVIYCMCNELDNVAPDFIDTLTSREIEIVKLISQSLTDYEIADKLNISKSTVASHMRNILSKNNIFNRIELATKYQNCLVLNAKKNIKNNLEYKF